MFEDEYEEGGGKKRKTEREMRLNGKRLKKTIKSVNTGGKTKGGLLYSCTFT